MKERLIVIAGPTAVGKTELSVRLSRVYNGEVLSGDSMQVYKGLDIGTAKATKEEQKGVPHHLIDLIEPSEPFSVAQFQNYALPLISNINRQGRVPILVGGTGLYIHSILKGYELGEMISDEAYRNELEKMAEQFGNDKVYTMLREVDEKAAGAIHPNNVRRVIRALEVYRVTGIPFSAQQIEEKRSNDIYETAFIGLTMDREKLYERINKRVDLMIEDGLLAEARELFESGIRNVQSVQAIGYKELFEYFNEEITCEEAIEKIKRNSRRYAKRQLTWFKNKSEATWFDMSNGLSDEVFNDICGFIEGKIESLAKCREE